MNFAKREERSDLTLFQLAMTKSKLQPNLVAIRRGAEVVSGALGQVAAAQLIKSVTCAKSALLKPKEKQGQCKRPMH